MILHYPLESGSFQSDSNQTRTTAYQLSCGVTSGHTEHHSSCVNGTLIVIAICHQASCNLIELRKTRKHTIPIKNNQHLEKNQGQAGSLPILSESIQKERTMLPFSLPLLTIPSLNYNHDPWENGTVWYGMCLMSKYSRSRVQEVL